MKFAGALSLLALIFTPIGLACFASVTGNIGGALLLVAIQFVVLWMLNDG